MRSALSAITTLAGLAIALQRPLTQPSELAENIDEGTNTSNDGLPFSAAKLEEYILDVMERWHAAGMAVAIIHGNETWAKGFGYAHLPSTPVTPHTLFFTGSTTKSFTAAGLSLLIDNASSSSELTWTTPISHLLPDDFVLASPWNTAHLTLEDALCHRTGYPRHDLATRGNNSNVRDVVRTLRHLEPSAPPRTKFQYNNMMFMTVGYLLTKLTGLDMATFFWKYLWEPMGMHETFLADSDPRWTKDSDLDLAGAYWWLKDDSTADGGRYVEQFGTWANIAVSAGAGATVSNVLDYAKYLRVMMAEEKPLSKAAHRELKKPRTFHEFDQDMFVGPVTYGLGWMGGVFEGEEVFWHGGTVTPYVTNMLMVPGSGYGVVLMANSYSKVRELVTYRILYDLFGVEQERRRDWESQFEDDEARAEQKLATCPPRLYPDVPSPPIGPTVPLAAHTGQFRHVAYGDVFISLASDDDEEPLDGSERKPVQLLLKRGADAQQQIDGRLQHASGDFWLAWLYPGEVPELLVQCVRTQFRVDVSGRVTHVGVDFRWESEDTPLVWFSRVE